MNDKNFDQELKEKFKTFESAVPADLWGKIEKELDAVKSEGPSSVEHGKPLLFFGESKKNKTVRSVKQLIVLYGSVAAVLVFAFVFLKNNESKVIYLRPDAKVLLAEQYVDSEEGSVEEDLTIEEGFNQKKEGLISVSESPVKYGLSDTKLLAQASPSLDGVVENGTDQQLFYIELVEQQIALSSIGDLTELQRPLERSKDSHILALQEPSILLEEHEDSVEEGMKIASSKRIGVSTVLNFLTKGLNNEREKSIEFSETEDGILKWDVRSSLAKKPE